MHVQLLQNQWPDPDELMHATRALGVSCDVDDSWTGVVWSETARQQGRRPYAWWHTGPTYAEAIERATAQLIAKAEKMERESGELPDGLPLDAWADSLAGAGWEGFVGACDEALSWADEPIDTEGLDDDDDDDGDGGSLVPV